VKVNARRQFSLLRRNPTPSLTIGRFCERTRQTDLAFVAGLDCRGVYRAGLAAKSGRRIKKVRGFSSSHSGIPPARFFHLLAAHHQRRREAHSSPARIKSCAYPVPARENVRTRCGCPRSVSGVPFHRTMPPPAEASTVTDSTAAARSLAVPDRERICWRAVTSIRSLLACFNSVNFSPSWQQGTAPSGSARTARATLWAGKRLRAAAQRHRRVQLLPV